MDTGRKTGESCAELDWPLPGVARLTLTRPASHNTLTYEALDAVGALCDEAADGDARVLIVTGSGRSFCSGAHIDYFVDPQSRLYRNPRAIRDDYVGPIVAMLAKLRDARFATIAAVNGFALGGGCELALACDFRLMGQSARIGLPEVRLGALPGASGVQVLQRIVGRARALEIALLGDQWSADTAHAIGLVHGVHADAELGEAALALARRLLACSPVSIAETKRAIYRCEVVSAEEADRIGLDAVAIAASGEEWWEGMAAFIGKRAPAFRQGDQ
ncbi:enoyl-CoA hydratase/isomerase family protein [Arvimicrobium flavum]|uniref:enoyl-CoA hydratase/isomerase family protein n=1 Tax=Arvimicrobium flavum TaxID=3393320 RepID=UPI00237A6F8F|nr:enoyl-CoA hydratase/isomerase family protein [Mesorhizobium shangrilense]